MVVYPASLDGVMGIGSTGNDDRRSLFWPNAPFQEPVESCYSAGIDWTDAQ